MIDSQEKKYRKLFEPKETDWCNLQQFIKPIQTHQAASGRSLRTRIEYVKVIKKFLNHVKVDPKSLKAENMQSHFNQLTLTLKPSSCHLYRHALNWYLTKVIGM